MKKYPTQISFLLILILAATAVAREKFPTNEALIATAITSTTDSLLRQHLPGPSALVIGVPGSGELEKWVGNLLTDSCVSANYFVYSSADSSATPAYRLAFSDPAVAVQYTPGGRKWLVGKKKYQREIDIRMHLQLLDSSGRYLYSGQLRETVRDTIPGYALRQVENPALAFTMGTKSQNSIIKRWVEPLLITVATASVIYAFFLLRSEN